MQRADECYRRCVGVVCLRTDGQTRDAPAENLKQILYFCNRIIWKIHAVKFENRRGQQAIIARNILPFVHGRKFFICRVNRERDPPCGRPHLVVTSAKNSWNTRRRVQMHHDALVTMFFRLKLMATWITACWARILSANKNAAISRVSHWKAFQRCSIAALKTTLLALPASFPNAAAPPQPLLLGY